MIHTLKRLKIYHHTVGSLHQFEQSIDANAAPEEITVNNSSSFKYKSRLLGRLDSEVGNDAAGAYRLYKNAQILVPLKFVSSFFRSLELPLINTKIHLDLSWKKTV